MNIQKAAQKQSVIVMEHLFQNNFIRKKFRFYLFYQKLLDDF